MERLPNSVTVNSRDILALIAEAAGDWEAEDYTSKLDLNSECFLVMADMHIPKFDRQLFADSLRIAKEYDVKDYIFLGDLMDMEEFSSFGIMDESNQFRRNLSIAGRIIRMVTERGMRAVWTEGNHEARFFRAVKQALGMEDLARLAGVEDLMLNGTLLVHDNPTILMNQDSWMPWMLTHPKSYGAAPLMIPSKLATRFQMNVWSAHAHHWGMTTDETGNFVAVEAGGGFDPRMHEYIQHQVTTHRSWQKGFGIARCGGMPILYRGMDIGIPARSELAGV